MTLAMFIGLVLVFVPGVFGAGMILGYYRCDRAWREHYAGKVDD